MFEIKNIHRVSVGGLITLGLVLVAHPLIINAQQPVYEGIHTVSQFVMNIGWVYLLVGVASVVFVYRTEGTSTPWRFFLAAFLLFPVLMVVFYTDFLRLAGSASLNDALETTLLLVPVVLAFPMGIAVRSRCREVLVAGGLSWFVGWAFLPVAEIGGLFAFIRELYVSGIVWMLGGLLFMWLLLLPYYVAVLPFVLPPFLVGVVFDPSVGESSAKATEGQ